MSNDQKIESSNSEFVIEKNGLLYCRKHPKYLGLKAPKVDCEGCRQVFEQRQKIRNQS